MNEPRILEILMRKIMSVCMILFMAGCAASEPIPVHTNTPFLATRPDDFQVEYYWETGSLPPPYFYFYEVTIGPGPEGEIRFQADYSEQDPPIWIEPIAVSENDLDRLYGMLVNMGMFAKEWLQAEDIPDGGSASKLSVRAYGQNFTIPSYVAGEQLSKDARTLYKHIENLVPQETWDKLMVLHDEYVAENEED